MTKKKKARALPTPVEGTKDIFDPIEREILNRYFGLPTTLPREALDLSRTEWEERQRYSPDWEARALGVRLEPSVSVDSPGDGLLARAVGRICMQVVGCRKKPVRGATLASVLEDRYSERPYKAPRLCSIEWSSDHWPEDYWVVYVPGFDRHVIVRTTNSDDGGGAWLALGSFARGEPAVEAAGRALRAWWRFTTEWSLPRWRHFLSSGIVVEEVAAAWADEVWADSEEGEDEEGDAAEDADAAELADLSREEAQGSAKRPRP